MPKNTKHVLLREPVTLFGGRVEADEILELTTKSAQALIEEGKAIECTPDEETKEALEKAEAEQDDTQETPEGENTQGKEDGVERLKKALDDQYKRDDLAEAAKGVGVEIAYDARKGEIIEAVIAAGKAETLLK